MKNQYRTEKKYLLGWQEYYVLRNLLHCVMHRDANASENGDYTIRSIYFDSADHLQYTQKLDGILERRKIRLRTYGEHASGNVKLEIKNKWNDGIHKEVARLQRSDAQALLLGDTDRLLRYEDDVAAKVFGIFKGAAYQPVVAIDYEREAYTLPFDQIRITFDKNLRCASEALTALDAQRTYFPAISGEYVILEVKYNHFLPEFIRRILGSISGVNLSISKYCLARQLVG